MLPGKGRHQKGNKSKNMHILNNLKTNNKLFFIEPIFSIFNITVIFHTYSYCFFIVILFNFLNIVNTVFEIFIVALQWNCQRNSIDVSLFSYTDYRQKSSFLQTEKWIILWVLVIILLPEVNTLNFNMLMRCFTC